ncbi:glycosyltransferase family 9 protein [Microcoleus sp. FACHB-1515]|uniref:glycosyltransferase family 9 protein n=1 Tax=Cyanophyceae TaxID=3028117 RepID=UPI0016835C94|nr:glycosyltransferase family 9 protein [Microcoleus sp. FACHB-1515]MBD2091728.1 glycosyltransferase family 9 protein [Microcoleus sp. FACHB-1515]
MKSILFVELLGGLGDVLIALGAIQALARSRSAAGTDSRSAAGTDSHSAAKLCVLTFAPGAELLEHDPAIAEVLVAPPGQARQAVETLLRDRHFDLIVSDTNYDGIEEVIRASSAARTVTNLWRSPPDDEFVGDRFCQILQKEGLITKESILPARLYLTEAEQRAAQIEFAALPRPIAFLIPDAGMAIKRWPTDSFITVGNALRQDGVSVVVPIGSDANLSKQIAAAIDGTVLPKRSLRQLAASLSQGDLCIAADTGPARIAAALDVPTITLFGPSWHDRYGQPAPHINLQGAPDCPDRQPQNFTAQACWYSAQCSIADWQTCLADISPETVLQAARSLLAPKPQTLISQWSSVRNLLVLRMDNIGDVIMTSPALRSLKENLPQAKITLMASPGGALAAELLPWVDQVLPVRSLWQNLGRLDFDPSREWQLIEELRSHAFDAAIIFTSFSQSPHPPALVCQLAGIPLRLGESKETGGTVLTTEVAAAPDEIHQVDRNLRLLESVGFTIRDRSLSLQIPNSKFPIPNSYLVLNPWTSCQSRNYDGDRFAQAARQLADRTGFDIIVTGVEKDRDRSRSVLKILGDRAVDAIGKTSLGELTALIAQARLLLTNNTSTMHIADATRTPTVVMFAGTELECQWQPRSTRAKLLRRPTSCSPCYAFTCPYNLECLDISVEEVVKAGLELLR